MIEKHNALMASIGSGTTKAGACRGILNWDYFKGRKLRGLTNRRRAEYKMCVRELMGSGDEQ
jgi:GH24 family phage-related lysozyme (muramidase)